MATGEIGENLSAAQYSQMVFSRPAQGGEGVVPVTQLFHKEMVPAKGKLPSPIPEVGVVGLVSQNLYHGCHSHSFLRSSAICGLVETTTTT